MSEEIAGALRDAFFTENMVSDAIHGNVPEAIYSGFKCVARSIELLGNADAATQMGGLEAHGKIISESLDRVASAISELAEAVRDRA